MQVLDACTIVKHMHVMYILETEADNKIILTVNTEKIMLNLSKKYSITIYMYY